MANGHPERNFRFQLGRKSEVEGPDVSAGRYKF